MHIFISGALNTLTQYSCILALKYVSLTLCVVIFSTHVFITTLVSAMRGAIILLQEWVALVVAFLGVIWFCSAANASIGEKADVNHHHDNDEEENPLMTGIALSLFAALMYSF